MLSIILLISLALTSHASVRSGIYNTIEFDDGFPEKMDEASKEFRPDWDDLDTRVLPSWYDKAKIGIFLHWGVYAVPSFGSEWFWVYWKNGDRDIKEFMTKNYPPGFSYQDFAPHFTAEFFNAKGWANLFAKAGAKYVVLTSKHHEGFTMFPSAQTFSWNSVDVGPRRDILGELSTAVRAEHMKFGVYHSLYEWFNPKYLHDKQSNFKYNNFVTTKLWPDLLQIIRDYKPSLIWADGDWEAHDTYWQSTEFLAYLYNKSPVKDEVVVNDRWGIGVPGKHGDFFNYADRFNNRTLLPHKWENAFTVDKKSWGFRRDMKVDQILTAKELVEQVVSTVSCGGNVLINIGPTREGTICPIFQERLLALGSFLEQNGEAIYETSPWYYQNDALNLDVWYTCKGEYNEIHPTAVPKNPDSVKEIYAIFLKWPRNNTLSLQNITKYLHDGNYSATLLSYKILLEWQIVKGKTEITLPELDPENSELAWTVKFTKL